MISPLTCQPYILAWTTKWSRNIFSPLPRAGVGVSWGGRSGCLVKVWILDRWRAINFAVLVDWIPIGKLRGCESDEVLDNLNLHHPQSHCRQVLAKTKRAARSWKLRGGSAPQVLSEGAPSRYVGVLGCLSKGRREWVSERSDFNFSAIYRATWRYQSKPYCTNTLQVIKFLFIVSESTE